MHSTESLLRHDKIRLEGIQHAIRSVKTSWTSHQWQIINATCCNNIFLCLSMTDICESNWVCVTTSALCCVSRDKVSQQLHKRSAVLCHAVALPTVRSATRFRRCWNLKGHLVQNVIPSWAEFPTCGRWTGRAGMSHRSLRACGSHGTTTSWIPFHPLQHKQNRRKELMVTAVSADGCVCTTGASPACLSFLVGLWVLDFLQFQVLPLDPFHPAQQQQKKSVKQSEKTMKNI